MEFFSKWDVTEYPCSVDNIDVMWSSAAEEQRENVLLRQAFVIERPHCSRSLPPQVDRPPVAESALKARIFLLVFEQSIKKDVDGPINS